MKTLTRYVGRDVLVATLAIFVALRSLVALPPIVSGLTPVYFHLFMVGWVTQMIFGVIFWMFPIVTRARPRGSERRWMATSPAESRPARANRVPATQKGGSCWLSLRSMTAATEMVKIRMAKAGMLRQSGPAGP